MNNKSGSCVAEYMCACMCVLCSSMGGMERSVRLGLVALAMSDMLFCSLYLMSTWIPNSAKYSPYDNLMRLYFRIYHEVRTTHVWRPISLSVGRLLEWPVATCVAYGWGRGWQEGYGIVRPGVTRSIGQQARP